MFHLCSSCSSQVTGALVEQELLTLPEHLISPQIISGFVSLNVCFLCVFFLFCLSFFIWSFYCLSFFNIPLLIIPLAFPNYCSFSDKQANINTLKNTSWNKCVMNMACLLLMLLLSRSLIQTKVPNT